MKLVHVDVIVIFARTKREESAPIRVFKALGGSGHQPQPEKGEVSINMMQDRTNIYWTREGCGILCEKVSNLDDCTDKIMDFLARANKAVPIRQMAGIQFDTKWIIEANDYDFSELERKYRKAMLITPTGIDGTIIDSSALFDIQLDSDSILHHQSGAMRLQQLEEDILFFDPEELPKTFLFLEAQVARRVPMRYSGKEMRTALSVYRAYCESHAAKIEKIWRKAIL